jgi:hypothetical protein
MDLLAQYSDSDDEQNDQPQSAGDGLLSKLKMSINVAPVVKDDVVVSIYTGTHPQLFINFC